MIDLHIHTTHSDGDYTVTQILQKAEDEKLDIISITDHNQISAYDELDTILIKNYFKGKIIVGTELKCVYNHMPVEILAYGFNRIKMQESGCITTPQKFYEIQSKYLAYIKEQGRKIGLFFNPDVQIVKGELTYAAATFERELWKDKRNIQILANNGIDMNMPFYRESQSNKNSIFYIDETQDYPEMQEVIDEIHKAKGLAFLAHLYEYPLKNHEETIMNIVKEHNLDGIECCHSNFTKAQSKYLMDFCKKENLYMSGGSDYHGKAKPKVKFARAVEDKPIKTEIIQNWCDSIEYYTK